MSRGTPETHGTRWLTGWLPRLLADDGDVLPVLCNKFFAFVMSTRMLLYILGIYDGPSCFLPRRLLLLLTPPWTRTSWYPWFLLHSHAPDYVMPSRAIQPTSTSRATANVPNETAMEEGLLVPRRAISLAKQSFWRLPSTSLPCKRRVPTWLAQSDFPGTLPFPLMLVQKHFTVYSSGFALLSQIAVRMIVPPVGTNRISCSLRIPASSQSLPRPLLGESCSWSPFALLMLGGLIPKYAHGGPVLTNLWQPGDCISVTLCFWETRMDELDPTSRVLSDPL